MSTSPLWVRLLRRDKNAIVKKVDTTTSGPSLTVSFKLNADQSQSFVQGNNLSVPNQHSYRVVGNSPGAQSATIAAVVAAAATAAFYAPKANASIVSDLADAITSAITKPLEKISKAFTDTFSGMMDKGNQEQIVAVAKGFDSVNEMIRYAYNQKQFAESQPDPNHCEAADRARLGAAAQTNVEQSKVLLSVQSSSDDINTTSKIPTMVRARNQGLADMIGSFSNGKVSFNNISPTVLQGRVHDVGGNKLDAALPASQTHSEKSAERATAFIAAIRAPLDSRMPKIDVDLLRQGDIRQSATLVEVTAKKARTAMLMQPFTDELAERLPVREANGKSKRELIHEGLANTYYSQEYNDQLSQLAAPTPVLIAIAKGLSYSNMLAYESLLKMQQQSQVLAVIGAESMERNNTARMNR